MEQFDPAKTNEIKRRIAPGIWIDGNGQGHISIPEILAAHDMEDTPENHELCKQMFKELLADSGMIGKYRSSPDDPGTPL